MRRTFLPAPPLPAGRPNLMLAGFMGTGKTTVGRIAADLLDMPFVDLDEVLLSRAGRSIREIFRHEGEEGFRARERAVLGDAARVSGAVVATGGGAVLHDAFADLAATGPVAVLRWAEEELVSRLSDDPGSRPLASDPATMRTLLAERALRYRDAGTPVEVAGRAPADVAAEVAGRIRTAADAPATIEVAVPGAEHRVALGDLDDLGARVVERLPEATAASVVADAALPADVVERARDSLEARGFRVALPRNPGGERSKTIATAATLWEAFLAAGLGRGDVVVALGGGATLDVAGFAAATYMRGVPLVTVPTTVLAMADAALGGKVAVDHAGVKNLAGAFHHPAVVLIDVALAATQPDGDRRAGLAEIVKTGVLASPLVVEAVDETTLGWAIEQAVRVKAAFVAADPLDRDLRHALNLGHTFAHGIEAASGYRVPHGEAVAAGLVAAARLGASLGITDPDLAGHLEERLTALGLPTEAPRSLDPGAVRAAMLGDKKRRGGAAVFVVPAAGGAEIVEGIDLDDALDALLPARVRP
ncbi:MAG TPA: bifunctional shikimate kinase/3-dehydroquinate synthase [Actinomycetota bacterium]|nr:bifunctional shikimate kinase/3-dehydroquinate synthase [Actinomycetota bacterium]